MLRRNTPFLFSTGCQDAFAGLKTTLTTAPCLALPDMAQGSLELDMVCDASGIGLVVVLLQSGRPTAFCSRKMVPADQKYLLTEQELLAACEASCAFKCYVAAVHRNLITDNKPNTHLDTQPTMSTRQTRWSEYLQRFNLTCHWEYRPGTTNVADPLSRDPAYCPVPCLLHQAMLCVLSYVSLHLLILCLHTKLPRQLH